MKLTRRQQEILEFIRDRQAGDGMPPTRAEIVKHFNFRSPNAAQCHLKALAERGAVKLLPGRARGIILIESDRPASNRFRAGLPVIGRVTAGTPILAVENREDELQVDPAAFSPRPDYILRVQGDSMIGAGIHDGDWLLVHRTPDARNGQIVVARIDDEITVKRLRRRGRGVFLEPENDAHKTIHVQADSDFAIEGLAVGVIRRSVQ
ncbi:MAG: transcriptional repressor LexA [Wenzhouxiangella sp.]|nr:transcriptional repressor LexA [Wenzhouxiangella sp.]MCH8477309.1 transcriptional repressor LexA [Wenzhouxiangella sp.]